MEPASTVGRSKQDTSSSLDSVSSALPKSVAAFAAADYMEYGGSTLLSTT